MWREYRRSETDRKIGNLFKKAIDNNENMFIDAKDIKVPEWDASLLNSLPRRYKRVYLPTGIKVAVILLAFFVTASALALMIANGTVNALKFKLEKIVYQLDEDVVIAPDKGQTDDTMSAVSDEAVELEIENLEDIDRAKRFLPELYIPEYIPEGYEFARLTISKKADSSYWGKYEYRREGSESLIIFFTSLIEKEAGNEGISNVIEILEKEDRTIYLCENKADQVLSSVMIKDGSTYILKGCTDQKEIIKIMESLCQ